MKKGDIKKVTFPGCRESFIAIIVEEYEDHYECIRIHDFSVVNLMKSQNPVFSSTRSVTPEMRALAKEYLKLYLKKKDAEAQVAEYRRQMYNVRLQSEKYRVTENFLCDLIENTAPLFFETLKQDGYRVDYDDGELTLTRCYVIQKYFRKSSFTYEEYDGVIFLTDSASTNKEYQQYLARYRRRIYSAKDKQVKPDAEYLAMGDKDSLCHVTSYNVCKIPVTTSRSDAERILLKGLKRFL